jgi:hypothetical protein
MAGTTKRAKVAAVVHPTENPPPAGTTRRTRAQALEVIFSTAIELGEGCRHGALGTPRYGKSYHLEHLIRAALEEGICDLALVHDTKREDPQYQGVIRANVAELGARPLGEDDPPIVVFHPDPRTGIKCTVEEVADLGLREGRNGGSVLVVVDELFKALKARQHWSDPSMGEILREGSSIRVSSAWSTQVPQSLPTEALDLTETTSIFMLQGRSLSYAIDAFRLPDEAAPVIKRLERGEFILVTNVGDWDGVIYGPT